MRIAKISKASIGNSGVISADPSSAAAKPRKRRAFSLSPSDGERVGGEGSRHSQAIFHELPIHQSPDLPLIFISQLDRQCRIRKILEANRTGKTLYRCRSYRREMCICRGGIRSPMVHRGANLDSGGKSVKDQ